MEQYVLKKPITTAGGEQLTEITLNLEDLSVVDLENCEKQAKALLGKKKGMPVPETNKTYLSCVAAKASGLKLNDIRSFGAQDYTQVCLLVQDFLLDGESEEEETEGEGKQTQKSGKIETSNPKQTGSGKPPSSTE